MLFALRSVTTVPMRVNTTDEAMFEDLAGLHAERLGLSADPLAGQLDDLFEVARDREGAVLLSVWLKPPGEGDLPVVSPGAFDLSARAIPVEGDMVTAWRELGRWVFAIHQSGKLLYAQATACESEHPDESLARELKFALMQLSMQGLDPKPRRMIVWSADTALDLSSLRDAFDLSIETQERPHPVLPTPASKLLPEDVRAARKEARKRQQVRLAIGTVAALYLALVGWLAYGLWQDEREIAQLERETKMAAPLKEAYNLHESRWKELADAIDIDHSPIEILHRIQSCIPPNAGVRLTRAEINPYNIKLRGEAPSNEAVNQLQLKLKKNASLQRYDWGGIPNSTPGKLGREFRYDVSLKSK